RLDDLGEDRVRVSGAVGAPPPATYKGLVCTPAGFSGEAKVAYSWPDAEAKAAAALRFLRTRAEQLDLPVREWHEEYFGVSAFGGQTVHDQALDAEPPEVLGRLVWRCDTAEAAAALGREVGALGLGGPPMVSPFGRGRDGRPTQLLALEALSVERPLIDESVRVVVETV
ncbi:MAG: acyclic terpene utilization AtuA family protein, partial [Actinomycetes bacterium]